MSRRRLGMHARVAAFGGVAVAALLGAAPHRPTVPGITYTMHYDAAPVGQWATTLPALKVSWTGVAVLARGRGRMDVVAGRQEGMFETGDYMLFEGGDYIVVHPATKSFSPQLDLASSATRAASAPGMKTTFDHVTVTLDSLGATDTIQGRPTRRFRINTGYTATIDLSGMGSGLGSSSIETKMTSDYWFAERDPALPLPFGASGAESARSMPELIEGLTTKMRAASAGLPAGRALLRTKNSTRVSGPPGMSGGSDNTMEISDQTGADIDVSRLRLPDDYVEKRAAAPDDSVPPFPSTDRGAKWRVRPGVDR